MLIIFRNGLDDLGVRDPAEAVNCSLHRRVPTSSEAHPASYPMGTRKLFPRGKAAEAWSYTCTPPIRLHGVVLN